MRARERYWRIAVERLGVSHRVSLWNGCERSSRAGSTFDASHYRVSRKRANVVLAAHPQAAAGQANPGVLVNYQRADFAVGFIIDQNHRRTVFAPQPIATPSPHRGQHVPE